MADLSPDLSIYRNVQPSGGLANSLDLGALMGIAQRARELQTQSAVSDIIKKNTDPKTGQVDWMQAGSDLKGSGAFLSPDLMRSVTGASQAQNEQQQWYMGQAADAMSSLVSKPNPTVGDFNAIAPLLTRMHVPAKMIADVVLSATTDGRINKDKLGALYNWVHNNAPPPTTTIRTPGTETTMVTSPLYGGQPGSVPAPQARPPAAGGGATAPTPPQDAASAAMGEVQRQYGGYGMGGGAVTNPSQQVMDRWNRSATQHAALTDRDYQGDTAPIRKALDILKQDPSATGRGLTELNNIKNFLHSFGFIKDKDMGGVTNFETLTKLMAGVANSGSMGGTDARLWQTVMGSASPDKLGSTNIGVLRFSLGLRNMQQVALDEFRRVGGKPELFSDWYNNWAKRQDPAAFVWDTMSEDEQRKYGKEHFKTKADIDRFQASYEAGQRGGETQ